MKELLSVIIGHKWKDKPTALHILIYDYAGVTIDFENFGRASQRQAMTPILKIGEPKGLGRSIRPSSADIMSRYIELVKRLQNGETITYKEFGNSMLPKMKNGCKVTVHPCKLEDCKVGDVVLAKVRGTHYLHYVKAIASDGKVQIGNAHGHINGWTHTVFGRLESFENP